MLTHLSQSCFILTNSACFFLPSPYQRMRWLWAMYCTHMHMQPCFPLLEILQPGLYTPVYWLVSPLPTLVITSRCRCTRCLFFLCKKRLREMTFRSLLKSSSDYGEHAQQRLHQSNFPLQGSSALSSLQRLMLKKEKCVIHVCTVCYSQPSTHAFASPAY